MLSRRRKEWTRNEEFRILRGLSSTCLELLAAQLDGQSVRIRIRRIILTHLHLGYLWGKFSLPLHTSVGSISISLYFTLVLGEHFGQGNSNASSLNLGFHQIPVQCISLRTTHSITTVTNHSKPSCPLLMAPRRRSPSVDSYRRPDRRESRDRERHRSASGRRPQRDASSAPISRSDRVNFNTSNRRSNHNTIRDDSRERPRRRSRDRSRSTSSRRVPRTDVYRPDAPVATRRRADSRSSAKRRRNSTPSPPRHQLKKHRRQGSANTDISRSSTKRYAHFCIITTCHGS